MTRQALALVGILFAATWSQSAFAQAEGDLSAVVKLACAAPDPAVVHDLSMEAMAEALLVQSGYPLGELVALGRAKTGADYRDALVATIISRSEERSALGAQLSRNVLDLSQALMQGSQVSAKEIGLEMVTGPARPTSTTDRLWVLRSPATTQFKCLAGEPWRSTREIVRAPTEVPFIGITKTVEDLGKADKRAAIDSAVLGIKVANTTDDDGSTRKTTTLTFDGTVGIRLQSAPLPAFAYANYTLSRARVKPAPELGPTERRDDGDTNGLALGFVVPDIPMPLDFSLTAGGSYVFDFVKDSRRAIGSLGLAPGFGHLDAGLCNFGALKTLDLGGIKLRIRCVVSGELAYSHVFRTGRADFEDRGDFVALGPVAGLDVLAPLGASAGVVGNARYRFLPTISGRAPDVHRLDLSLKYRWFVGNGVGLDFGGTYKHGEELKTYTREDEFLITFGIVR